MLLETLFSRLGLKRPVTKIVYSGLRNAESLSFQNPTSGLDYLLKTHRRCAFPIGELKINCAIQVWIWAGVTLWLLENPGRLWPWFALGGACLAALCIALLEIQEGSVAGALAFGAIAGGPLAWTGWSVQSLGYVWLGWICIGFAGLFAVAAIVRCILAAWPRSSNP